MLVLSIKGADLVKNFARIAALSGLFDLLEVRLDEELSDAQQQALLQLGVPICLTLRENYPFENAAWSIFPYLIDVPWRTPSPKLFAIRKRFPTALLQGSAHDDPLPAHQLLDEMRERGFNAVKIATTVASAKEMFELLAFLKKNSSSTRLTCVPMGEAGQAGRLLAPTMNSFLSFGCLPGAPTAPGQFDIATLHALYHAKDLSPTTKRFALIGDPVSKSPSDQTHTNLLRHFGIDGLYVKIPVSLQELPETLPFLELLEFSGISVTSPLKEACGEEGLPANTLKRVGKKMVRTNTDAPALIEALQERGTLLGARVLLLGAGGVATAALRALLEAGAEVFVHNRTHEKAVGLVKKIGGAAVQMFPTPCRYDIVVNATSADPSFSFRERGVRVAADFSLSISSFFERAVDGGALTISGEELWARQAAKQFHWWCGIDERQSFFYLMKSVFHRTVQN